MFVKVKKSYEHVIYLRQEKTKKEISLEYAIFRFPIFRPKSLTEKFWNFIKLKLQFVLFSFGLNLVPILGTLIKDLSSAN